MIIAFPLVFLGNMIEYFSVTKDNLKKIDGKVSEVILKTYKCSKGFRGKYSGVGICEKTIIKLENVSGSFHVSDYEDKGAYIEGIQKGDNVSVYIRKWYQYILTFGAGKDIYGLEKDGISYYDINRWKISNIACMIIFGILTVFFGALYILQRITVNELLKGKRV
jgi:hypothetical protein